MVPEMLQDDLIAELNELLADRKYKNTAGQLVPMTIYPQNIPITESDDDADPIPYIIVRLNSGEDSGGQNSAYLIKLVIIIGIYDDGLTAQGHREMLNIINLVYERFQKNPCLKNKYTSDGTFKWALQDDGYYPFYFSAIEMNFMIPAIRREDPLT